MLCNAILNNCKSSIVSVPLCRNLGVCCSAMVSSIPCEIANGAMGSHCLWICASLISLASFMLLSSYADNRVMNCS